MIKFDSVTKSFGEGSFALQEISFTTQPGELLVITGHSGSGKTTLMRLLTKEYLPTEGEIYFQDQPLSEIPNNKVHHHRRKIGVVFQDYKLIADLNVWENIALSLNIIGQKQAEIEQRVTDLLHLINLESKAFLFPSQLSGGEAQRVSIARALATAPSLIFADEPTGNLDADTSASIARLLQKINKLGTTVMIATHDTGVLDLLSQERHILIEGGRLVKDSHSQQKSQIATAKEVVKTASEPELPSQPDTKPNTKKTAALNATLATDRQIKDHQITQPETDNEFSTSSITPPKKSGFTLRLPHFRLPFGKKTQATLAVPAETKDLNPAPTPLKDLKTPAQPDAKKAATQKAHKVAVKVESL